MNVSQVRQIIAIITLAVLAGLFLWQRSRSQLINGCNAAGGAWNGATSKCVPVPGNPVIQRDLRRSNRSIPAISPDDAIDGIIQLTTINPSD